jgi:uncharacterized membrane protein
MQNNKSIVSTLTIGYFIIAFLEIFSEYEKYKPIIFIFKPLITITLISLYLVSSTKKDKVFACFDTSCYESTNSELQCHDQLQI